MSRHRAAPPPPRRPDGPANRHRATAVRPRYGRLAVAGTAVAVTSVALLGGVGVLPSVATGSADSAAPPASHQSAASSVLLRSRARTGSTTPAATPSTTPSTTPPSTPSSTPSTTPSTTPPTTPSSTPPTTPTGSSADSSAGSSDGPPALPADSGSGKRVVFSQGEQQVWLVDDSGSVVDSYPVSGSLYDNLQPGQYSVYSRSEDAVGVDDSGTMKYFVRFAHGPTGAAIGFHDIPIFDGKLVQTREQLGTPQSHGCVRQYRPDAIELWNFAPLGTEVDVVSS